MGINCCGSPRNATGKGVGRSATDAGSHHSSRRADRKQALKFLHVITTADPKLGGPIEGIRQRARILQAWGHQVEVASNDDPAAAFIPDFPLTLHALGPAKSSLAYSAKLRPWLLEHVGEYDALIANGIWQDPCIALREAAVAKGLPYWVFTHGMLDPYFNRAFPLKRLKKMLFWPRQYPVLRDAEAVLFTCEAEKILARESFRPYKVREQVVSYGTGGPQGDPEAQKAAFLGRFPELTDQRFILFLSRVNPKKGCDILLKGFADMMDKAPGVKLVIAGPSEDPYRSELDAIVRERKLENRVIWAGMLQGDVKWGAFRCAEAFILPSHQENFGIAVVEALASALPVLISKPVNIWREIEADGAGIVSEDTEEGVRTLLGSWFALSPTEREKMGTAARTCFEGRFTVERSAQSLIDVVQKKGVRS